MRAGADAVRRHALVCGSCEREFFVSCFGVVGAEEAGGFRGVMCRRCFAEAKRGERDG